jgi:hypothetical protein
MSDIREPDWDESSEAESDESTDDQDFAPPVEIREPDWDESSESESEEPPA